MGDAFAWVGQIVTWFGAFVPRWVIIDTTYGAVKFVKGKKVVPLGPGIHWYWPATTLLQQYPTARQADDLRSQTLVTTDDKTIIVSGMIVYTVDDIAALLANTYQASQTVKDIALTVIHDVCCQLSWDELKAQQRSGALDKAMKEEARKALSPYGVRVLKAMLTDLAPARVLKLLQTTTADN